MAKRKKRAATAKEIADIQKCLEEKGVPESEIPDEEAIAKRVSNSGGDPTKNAEWWLARVDTRENTRNIPGKNSISRGKSARRTRQ